MVRYVRDNFFRPLNTKLLALGLTLDTDTANEHVTLWLETVAHQRIHDTTREKPALRLIDERKALQVLPPKIVPITPSLTNKSALASLNGLSQQPLHHALSVYDQLMETI